MSDKQGWPRLDHGRLGPTVAHLHRLVQVAGKYSLADQFEPGWGNVVLDVTPRGLRTTTFHQDGRTFDVHYRLLDHDVVIASDTGRRSLDLRGRSVSDFYAEFVDAARELALPPPGSAVACEIPGARRLDLDTEDRPWDSDAARVIWAALNSAAGALQKWQAPFRGYRPRTGVMWGAFDLSATRYRARYTDPPRNRPPFLQHGMTEQYVSVGFAFGTDQAPEAGMYAYLAPQPDGIDTWSQWGVAEARWHPGQGLVLLPWNELIERPNPTSSIIAFGDAVYRASVELADWPTDLVMARFDGWHASKTPPADSDRIADTHPASATTASAEEGGHNERPR